MSDTSPVTSKELLGIQATTVKAQSKRRMRHDIRTHPVNIRLDEDVLKTSCERSWKRLQDVFAGRLQNVLEDVKLLRWRRIEDVFKTCLEEVFKTSWRPTNVCWALLKTFLPLLTVLLNYFIYNRVSRHLRFYVVG